LRVFFLGLPFGVLLRFSLKQERSLLDTMFHFGQFTFVFFPPAPLTFPAVKKLDMSSTIWNDNVIKISLSLGDALENCLSAFTHAWKHIYGHYFENKFCFSGECFLTSDEFGSMFCLQSVIFVKETVYHHFLETRLYYRQLILVNINCSRSRNSGRGNRQCRLDCRPAVMSGRQNIYEFAYVKLEPKWKADRRCNNLALPILLHSHVVENLSLPTCFRTASILGRENLRPGFYAVFCVCIVK
jgi:hypothetical protein